MISSSATIAATSIIEHGAVIGPHVVIGPLCFISAGVHIGEGTVIASHVVINGHTRIGRENNIGMASSLGEVSQDLKYAGEPTRLEIGDGNRIGRLATLHRGTVQGGGITRVGNQNRFEGGVHLGHDCHVGNGTFIGKNSCLAGHVTLGDFSRIDAMSAVHQFCVIGPGVYLRENACVVQDVPPFVVAGGNRAAPQGLNEAAEAFLNAGEAQQKMLRHLYDMLYHQQETVDVVKLEIERHSKTYPLLCYFNAFFACSTRGIIR